MKKLLLALLALYLAVPAFSQVHPPINQPVFRAFDQNGAPLVGGKLYTYAAGTSTPLATYSDAGAVTPNANPVVLDATGAAKIFLGFASYKFVLQDANGVQQWTVDNISGAPPASAVTSVFGRTGDVVAVTGDYTCAQITGAVCSTPTLYYQTLSANSVPVSPQRNALNFISGSGVTVSCADNSTNSRTDCTFASSIGAGTNYTCNANGCYYVRPDGAIVQWGTVTGCSGYNCTVAALFPTSFTTTANLTVVATPSNCGGANCAVSTSGLTTTGFTANYGALVYVGGSGTNLTGTQSAFWVAFGH